MSDKDSQIIRHDAPHQVTMKEGSRMAVGKKAEAIEPSVRKVLATEEGLTLEHKLLDNRLAVPEGQAAAKAAAQPSFERDIHQARALAPDAQSEAAPLGGLLLKRATSDHTELLPPEPRVQAPDYDIPGALARGPSEAGPLIPQFENDHFVAVPPPLAEKGVYEGDLQPAPAPAPAEVAAPQVLPVHADSDQTPDLSDAMAEMVQMNFPARVVKLKIENDKIRSKLDSLQGKATK
jgi:regulator of replication initiation timing